MDGCFSILMEEIHKYEGTINQFTGDGSWRFSALLWPTRIMLREPAAPLCRRKRRWRLMLKAAEGIRVEFKMRMGLHSGPVIVGSIG